MGFAKLDSRILQSSLWQEDSDTRIVWLTMLALADQHGMVAATAPGLATSARVPIEKTRHALDVFLSPDPDSRTPDNDGRRIERVSGGYMILNYAAYRNTRDDNERREYMRTYMAEYRRKHPVNSESLQKFTCKLPLAPVNSGKPPLAQAEAEAEAEAELIQQPPTPLPGGDQAALTERPEAERPEEPQQPPQSSCANHAANGLVRQFREKADGLGGLSLSTAREAIRSLLIGPQAFTAVELQDEIRKVEPGTGIFDWVRRMKQSRSPAPPNKPTMDAETRGKLKAIFSEGRK